MMTSSTLQQRLIVIMIAFALAGNASVVAQSVTYNESYTIQGFSQPVRLSSVAGATSGIIRQRLVREGDVVLQGEALIQLDPTIHQARLELARIAKDAKGEWQIAKAELASKTSRFERIESLVARNHATSVELLQANEDLTIARASLRRAEDRLAQQLADYNRLLAESEQLCIKAPFDGVVVEFTKQVGEFVGPGESTVCTIADLSELSVEFLVPRLYRSNLKIGSEIEVVFTIINRVVVGKIDYISPFPNGETNTYKVKARVDNSDGSLSAGERCLLREIETKSSKMEPSQAAHDAVRRT
ncbi:macrolide transporter subunit MacA [Rubripirellula lacrimiformis]|uniref:Macrolide transporter subunit MacA n=1 Tax=Rubripirellula lacrimiformis TaxID=1930273 RepID=A0A517NBE0_9BACT|nr:efflux RND transporter periplasmic adaptor subunit [Rubripirellula lacrimiformis]QDT04440.1 macrolide transporter subunit MacA [Rubripirellula lacrimiformis]